MGIASIEPFTPNLNAVLDGGIPAESVVILGGEPGAGKSTFAQHWMFHLLQRQPSTKVLYLTTLSDLEGFIVDRVRQARPAVLVIDSFKAIRDLASGAEFAVADGIISFGTRFWLGEYQRILTVLLHKIHEVASNMPRPVRIVFDSITPLSVLNDSAGFARLILEKNRLLRRPDVSLFDTHLFERTTSDAPLALLNGYDLVIVLHAPRAGDTATTREPRVAKARDVRYDNALYTYDIDPDRGVVLGGTR